MPIQLDVAATVTGVSFVIGSLATLVVALRGKSDSGSNDSDKKAVAVTEIKNTTDRVDILWEHIIDLREELETLKKEKGELETKYEQLSADLEKERGDHRETRRLLDEALSAIAEKDKQIKELEEKLNGKLTV